MLSIWGHAATNPSKSGLIGTFDVTPALSRCMGDETHALSRCMGDETHALSRNMRWLTPCYEPQYVVKS